MSARCLWSRLVLAVGVLMTCWCAPAMAGVTHPFLFSFGSFTNVQGVAVDQSTGDVYVLDTGVGGGSLLKFDAAGNPLKFTGLPGEPLSVTGLGGGNGSENELAVDSSSGPAKGDIYVAVSTSNGEQIDIISSDGESLGALSESTAPWGETCGVAVDPSGNVYVGIYGGYIDKYVPTANPVTNGDYASSIVGADEPCNLAADATGNVFTSRYGGGPVERYEASLFGQLSASGSIVDTAGSTLAVDPADNHVYVDAAGEVSEFGANGEPFETPLTVFGHAGSKSYGVAVNETSDEVYVSNGNGEISVYGADQILPDTSIQTPTAPSGESATLNGTVNPEGLPVSSCRFEYGTQAGTLAGTLPCSPSPGSGSTPVPVSALLTGLEPGTVYHYRLTATNASGASESGESTFTTLGPKVLNESFSNVGSASATVSAQIEPGGQPTTFHVEYGPTTAYGSSTSSSSIGAGTEAVAVTAHLDGLQPGSSYHFRVVATNEGAVAHGTDTTFSTLPLAPLGLPDNRGYEMVTPPENEDAQVYRPAGTGVSEHTIFSLLPARAAADGHAVTYDGDPGARGNGNEGSGGGNQYMATRGSEGGWTQTTIQPTGLRSPVYASFSENLSMSVLTSNEPLVAGVPSNYPYLYARSESDGSLQPLFVVKPPDRNTPATFGAANFLGEVQEHSLGYFYAGESADYKHLFFEANDALTPNAVDGGKSENNLYESTEGALRLVNVLPNGVSQPNAAFGAPPAEQEESENASHAISDDGSRVFWTDLNNGALYVREDGVSTALVAEDATFLTASADGSRVVYTKSGDLYEDDLSSGVTRDLAPGGRVLGLVGSSENLEYIYFVAEGSFAAGAKAGQPTLYLGHGGTTTLVAGLAPEGGDEDTGIFYGNGRFDDWRPAVGHRTAEVTPDGHALVFMSKQSLTGYDNRNQEGRPVSEVYVYDAPSGSLSCASCSPSDERPVTVNGGAAGYLATTGRQDYQVRSISRDGDVVFFQSEVPLVAQDVNGTTDVYEWERNGSGSCTLTTGCIYILSNGSGQGPSFLVDASEGGSDVFFGTEARLVPQDDNEAYDLYDARIGAEQPPSPLQCAGTGCQGLPAAPPIFATPSSVTFSGVGNFAEPAKAAGKSKPTVKKKVKRKHHRTKARGRRKRRAKTAKKATLRQHTSSKSGRGKR